MGAKTNFFENMSIDGFFRGGALKADGTAGSSTVVKGIWAPSTAYAVGDVVVPHANMTGAGGKFLRCTAAGTSGATDTLAVPNPGSTLADGTVTWTACSGIPTPTTHYIGLLKSSAGVRANSTAYALNDTIFVTANDSKIHLYKCTTAGTTAASQGALYPGAKDEAITDGTAVMTEQHSALDAGTAAVEPSGGGYARVAVTASLANWAGTQGAGTTTASTGTNGTTSNNNAITYPQATADWGTVGLFGEFDAAIGGNMLNHGTLSAIKVIGNGDTPNFPAASLTYQEDN